MKMVNRSTGVRVDVPAELAAKLPDEWAQADAEPKTPPARRSRKTAAG